MLDRMIAARTGLLLDEPFFGALALGLRLQEDPTCSTAWVDGRTMGFNPQFISKLSHAEIKTIIAHEVMHCAQGHPWRRDGRAVKRWNIACDKTINETLRDAKDDKGKPCFNVPSWAHFAEGPEKGQSAEWIYARLEEPEEEGDGEGDGDRMGQVRDSPTPGDGLGDGDDDGEAPSEAVWQQAVKQAAMAAKAQGKLPANLDRFLKEIGQPKVDWRSALRRFVQERAKADYRWNRPNTRYLSLGMYLPSLESHELGELAIGVDTSGSIDDVALSAAKAEVMAVVNECQPRAVQVYYADARVAQADRFERGDEIVWRPKGGGGTDFRPVFKACENAEDPPVCLLYITDLAGHFPESSEIPVIWVTDGPGTAPLGETVRM